MADLADIYGDLRKDVELAGGPSAWAKRVGVSPQMVCDVTSGRSPPGPKILAALGYQRRVTYVRSNHA